MWVILSLPEDLINGFFLTKLTCSFHTVSFLYVMYVGLHAYVHALVICTCDGQRILLTFTFFETKFRLYC